MSAVIQRSFSAGEISPELYARCDTAKYAYGARTMRNTWTKKSGGSQNRPGTSFVCETLFSANTCRFMPFIFSNDQAYVIELGNGYFRVYQDGLPLINYAGTAAFNILGISNANPCVVSVANASNIPTVGGGFPFPEVYFQNAQGLTELNGRAFFATNLNFGLNTFQITDSVGNPIDSSAMGTWTKGGTCFPTVGGTLPYAAAELPALQFAQSADVITITHPNHPVYELTRTSSGGQTFFAAGIATIGGEVSLSTLTGVTFTPGASGSFPYRYCLTGILEDGSETTPLILNGTTYNITGVTKANPCVITVPSTTGLIGGDQIYITGLAGMTQLNGRYFRISALTSTTITIQVDSRNFGTLTSGGIVQLASIYQAACAVPTQTAPNIIAIPFIPSVPFSGGRPSEFNVYIDTNGLFAYLGTTGLNNFHDTGIQWDLTINPPEAVAFLDHNPADDSAPPDLQSVPSCVSYVQQRLAFANFTDNSERVVASQIGRYGNFTHENPIVESDVVDFTIAGNRVAAVRFIFQLLDMVIFTQTGEFSASGNGGEVTPTQINLKKHSGNGCSNIAPIVINNTALYVQARGNVVRDFVWNWQVNGYSGEDLTTASYHLLEGHTIVDWAYQQTPNSIVWAVRDDGIVLGLTYMKEQQIVSWHHHDFQGGFCENVVSVPEGNEDAVYFVVRRTINGVTKRYVERLNTRLVDPYNIDDLTDAIFMDSAVTFDGRNSTSTTVAMTGSAWTYQDTVTLTASAATFDATFLGQEIHINVIDSNPTSPTYRRTLETVRFTINAVTSSTVVTGRPNKTVPLDMQGVAFTTWSRATKTVSGLNHLNGISVSVLGDGFVVANPNRGGLSPVTVAGGRITLNSCYAVIHAGIPYVADLETLDIDSPNGESIADAQKITSSVTLFLEKTRGAFVGPKKPSTDSPDNTNGLIELKPRKYEGYDDQSKLKTGKYDLQLLSNWNSNGRVFIRQSDPLPISVLAILEAGEYPFRGGV